MRVQVVETFPHVEILKPADFILVSIAMMLCSMCLPEVQMKLSNIQLQIPLSSSPLLFIRYPRVYGSRDVRGEV